LLFISANFCAENSPVVTRLDADADQVFVVSALGMDGHVIGVEAVFDEVRRAPCRSAYRRDGA